MGAMSRLPCGRWLKARQPGRSRSRVFSSRFMADSKEQGQKTRNKAQFPRGGIQTNQQEGEVLCARDAQQQTQAQESQEGGSEKGRLLEVHGPYLNKADTPASTGAGLSPR